MEGQDISIRYEIIVAKQGIIDPEILLRYSTSYPKTAYKRLQVLKNQFDSELKVRKVIETGNEVTCKILSEKDLLKEIEMFERDVKQYYQLK